MPASRVLPSLVVIFLLVTVRVEGQGVGQMRPWAEVTRDIEVVQTEVTRYQELVKEYERQRRVLDQQWQLLERHPAQSALISQLAVLQARVATKPADQHHELGRAWFAALSEDERALLGAMAQLKVQYDQMETLRPVQEAIGQRLERKRQKLLEEVRLEQERIQRVDDYERRERLRYEQEQFQRALAAQQEAWRQATLDAHRQALEAQIMGQVIQSMFPPRLQLNCTTIRSGQRATIRCY